MTGLSKIIVVGTLMVSASTAWAESEDVDSLSEARDLVAAQEFEAAQAPLQEALESGDLGPSAIEEAYRLLAECAAALRHPDEAREAFVNLLAIDPEHSVGATESPLLREPYERARAYWEENPLPVLEYEPPPNIAADEPLRITLSINTEAAPLLFSSIRLNLEGRDGAFTPIRGTDGRFEVAPERFGDDEEVVFYLSAHDEYGNVVARVGSERNPLRISVVAEGATDVGGTTRPRRTFYRRWWFWTTLIGVVGLSVGLSVGLTLGLSGRTDPCEEALGSQCEYVIDL